MNLRIARKLVARQARHNAAWRAWCACVWADASTLRRLQRTMDTHHVPRHLLLRARARLA